MWARITGTTNHYGADMDNPLPKWEDWNDQNDPYVDMDGTLSHLMAALDRGIIEAMSIGLSPSAMYSVSTRRDGLGWETYYGMDLGNTIARAVMQGPQTEPKIEKPLAEWNKPKSVKEAVTTMGVEDAKTLAPLYGVHYKFNSEDVKQLRNDEYANPPL